MGRSRKTPPPPKIKKAPPAAEQLDPAVFAMLMRQQRSRRARPYLTKGQRVEGDLKRETLTPEQSAKRAKVIKTATKDPLKGYVAPERAQVRGTGFDRMKFFDEDDKSYETRDTKAQAEFLSKQSGVSKLKTPGEVAPDLKQKLDDVPEGPRYHGKRKVASNNLNNAYNAYLETYVRDAKKQLEKQYSTTQLRNLGIR